MNAGRTVVLVLSLAVMFVGAALLAESSQRKLAQEKEALRLELAPFLVPNIEFRGGSYIVRQGEVSGTAALSLAGEVAVLRAAYASVLNRLDPLWGMEGTDPGELRESTEELAASQKRIAAIYPASLRAPLSALYPTQFLSSLADAEEARQSLLRAPSPERIQAYYGKLDAALRAHEAYVSDLERVFEEVDETSSSVEFNFIGGTAQPHEYREALRALADAERMTQEALASRERCTIHYSKACPSLRSAFAAMVLPRNSASPSPEPLPKAIITTRRVIDAFLDDRLSGVAQATSSQIVALSRQSCFQDAPFRYYEFRPEARSGRAQFKLTYLNQLYFYDIQNGGNPYFEHLKAQGVQFLFQSINNLYMCPDISADYTAATTLFALRDAAASAPPLGSEAVRERLISEPILRDTDAAAYVESLRAELGKEGERGPDSLRAESLIALFDQHSARFDQVIRTAVTQNALAEDRTYSLIDLPSLMLSRNYFLLFLLSANSTVAPAPVRLLNPKPFEPSEFKLLTYDAQMQKRYSETQMIAELIRGKRAEHP